MHFLYVTLPYTALHHTAFIKIHYTVLPCCDSPIKTTNGEKKIKKKHTTPPLPLCPILNPYPLSSILMPLQSPSSGLWREGKTRGMFPGRFGAPFPMQNGKAECLHHHRNVEKPPLPLSCRTLAVS